MIQNLYSMDRKKKIIVPIDSVCGESTPLIILKNTGVFYTAQCDGLNCSHLAAEGYVISIGNFAGDFDECSFGCSYISQDLEVQMKLGDAFDLYCIERCDGWRWKIRFDFERVKEVREGWIPVICNGTVDDFYDFELVNAKGIIHSGNCD